MLTARLIGTRSTVSLSEIPRRNLLSGRSGLRLSIARRRLPAPAPLQCRRPRSRHGCWPTMAISARPSIFSSIGAICCLSLGRGARGGRWLVRWRTNARRYRQEVLATADDALAADGVTVLAFNQAVIRARDVSTRLSFPKIISARSNDAALTKSAQREWLPVAGPRDRTAHPCSTTDASASDCNNRYMRPGSAGDAARRR